MWNWGNLNQEENEYYWNIGKQDLRENEFIELHEMLNPILFDWIRIELGNRRFESLLLCSVERKSRRFSVVSSRENWIFTDKVGQKEKVH